MNNKIIANGLMFLLLGLTLQLSACRPGGKNSPERNQKGARIICGSPSITEMVFALQQGDRVVGVSDYSIYPPAAETRTKIGGLFNPNRERIISLQPDLFISQGKNAAVARLCREQKIELLSLRLDSLPDIPAAILILGRILEAESRAEQLSRTIELELEAVRALTSSFPRRKVFITLGHTPGDLTGLMTSGPGTFLHELIAIAGGENIFSDAAGLYPQISKEALVIRQPEIILEIFPDGISEGNRALLRQDWNRMATLPAVKNGRIYYLTDDFILIPGVRIGQTARKFAALFHPEIVAEE